MGFTTCRRTITEHYCAVLHEMMLLVSVPASPLRRIGRLKIKQRSYICWLDPEA